MAAVIEHPGCLADGASIDPQQLLEVNDRPLALLPSAAPSLLAKPRAQLPPAVYVSADGVARVFVLGALLAGDYARIGREFAAARDSDQVREIHLMIDSPGGAYMGALELSAFIAEGAGAKPVFALIGGMGCSAAYAIASAADRVLLTPSASVGSIGVIMVHFDFSDMLSAAGVAVTHVFSGSHKADGSPYMPLADDVRERWQGEVDAAQERFASFVSHRRNLTTDAVLAQEAAVFEGPTAIAAGLADGLFSPFNSERNNHA